MVNNSKAYKITKYAIMTATIFVAMLLDRVISIGLPISTAACVLLVTFSFCYLENTWQNGILTCTLFGFVSFIKEFIFPSSIAAFPVYVWPIITILPRAAMGAVAFGTYRFLLLCTRKLHKQYVRQTLCITVATLLGNLTNTVLFLLTLNICKSIAGMEYTSLILVIEGVLLTNILPEYSISMILGSQVVLGVRRGLKLGVDGNNLKRFAKAEQTDTTELRSAQPQASLIDSSATDVINGKTGASASEAADKQSAESNGR